MVGIMPITSWDSFIRRCKWSNCHIPQQWLDELEPLKSDDEAIRRVGTRLVSGLCERILSETDISHLHLLVSDNSTQNIRYTNINSYTMNLAQSTKEILTTLGLTSPEGTPSKKSLPWRPSLGLNRRDENVR